MKKSRKLYIKFILAYVCFAVLCVVVVITITSPITYNFLVRQKAAELYRSANEISNTYAEYFYDDSLSTDDVKNQLKASGDFLLFPKYLPDGFPHIRIQMHRIHEIHFWILPGQIPDSRAHADETFSEVFPPMAGNQYHAPTAMRE